jgi:hypothetical protein
MTGIRTSCRDSESLGRVGCGATYSGNMVHCTICHQTFASYRVMDKHMGVKGGQLWHRAPEAVPGIHSDTRGIWRQDRRQGATGVPGALLHDDPESSPRPSR